MPASTRSRSRIFTSPAGTSKTGVSAGNRTGIGLPAALDFALQSFQLVGQPSGQVVRQVVTEGNSVAFSVLFVGGVEHGKRFWAVEVELSYCERCQLGLAKAGQHQRLVDQRPFPAEQVEAFPGFRPEFGVPFAFSLSLADRGGVEQRAAAGNVKQLGQFGFGQRPALPSRVGLLVRLRHAGKRIPRQPANGRIDAPVTEAPRRRCDRRCGSGPTYPWQSGRRASSPALRGSGRPTSRNRSPQRGGEGSGRCLRRALPLPL